MQFQRVCHDTLPWLISFSLDDVLTHAIAIPAIFLAIRRYTNFAVNGDE
jgi:hypothetical protein